MAANIMQTSVVDDLVTFLGSLSPSCQLVLVLCGIPGSGKSTFSKGLCEKCDWYASENAAKRHWRSFNQDALGSRNAVYREADSALRQGFNIIIDRCNFDLEQRAHWIRLANGWRNTVAIALVMPNHTDLQVCEERAFNRVDDIHDPLTDWHAVCSGMARSYLPPTRREGFAYVVECVTSQELENVQIALASS
eukprot:gene28545-34457_t